MISEGGSHLKQGSRLAIFMVIIDDRVPSNARPFLLLVLFSPTTETPSQHLRLHGATPGPVWATAASLSNSLAPVTYGKCTKNTMEKHTLIFD